MFTSKVIYKMVAKDTLSLDEERLALLPPDH